MTEENHVAQPYERLPNWSFHWSIHDEKRFLDHLGTGKWSTVRKSRVELLQNYVAITGQRKEPWTKLALTHAKKLLAAEMRA